MVVIRMRGLTMNVLVLRGRGSDVRSNAFAPSGVRRSQSESGQQIDSHLSKILAVRANRRKMTKGALL